MLLFYFHRSYKKENLPTIAFLQSKLGEAFVPVFYDYNNADTAFEQMIDILAQMDEKDTPNPILVGEGLGGFWADYFARLFKTKCILINPVIKPSIQLKYYSKPRILSNTIEYIDSFKTYENQKFQNKSRLKILGVKGEPTTIETPFYTLQRHKVVLNGNEINKFKDPKMFYAIIKAMGKTPLDLLGGPHFN